MKRGKPLQRLGIRKDVERNGV